MMKNAAKKRAQAQLNQVATAIDDYKAKLGYYPPDNHQTTALGTMVDPSVNSLYYELVGCIRLDSATYRPMDAASSPALDVTTNGLGVTGIMNASAGSASDDDNAAAQSFLKEIKPSMYATDLTGVRRLSVNLVGPVQVGNTGASAIISNWSPKPIQL